MAPGSRAGHPLTPLPGRWLSGGEEITHGETIKAFTRCLKQEADGYWISIGWNRKKIEIEDTARFVTRIDRRSDGESETIDITLGDETKEKLNFRSLKFSPDRLTCLLKSGEEAKFLSPAYFDLLKELEQDERGYFLRLGSEAIYL